MHDARSQVCGCNRVWGLSRWVTSKSKRLDEVKVGCAARHAKLNNYPMAPSMTSLQSSSTSESSTARVPPETPRAILPLEWCVKTSSYL